jgi:hypothetical protein
MDGALLDITALSDFKPYKTLGATQSGKAYGRYAFVSDNGYYEPWQGIPALKCVLTPLHMTRASALALAFYTTPTGTVTPWTITSSDLP